MTKESPMRIATRFKLLGSTRWRKTGKEGIFSIDHQDGTSSYIATWDEQRPIDVADPFTTRRRSVERSASTFEAACHLQAQGEAAERRRQLTYPQSRPQRLGERLMAGKWFEYWVRR